MYAKTIVVGRLGKDPEMRYTPSGVPVTSFSMATDRRWTNQNGEQQEKTTWFRVTCWRKLAELTAQYLQKGSLVLVEGDVDASSWTDREGNARASLELTATTVKFMPRGTNSGEGGGSGPNAPRGGGGVDEPPVMEDDIPF